MFLIKIRKKVKNFLLNLSFSTNRTKVGIFGYSGSGKSLSLSLIAGFLKPDEGEIKINNVTFYSSKCNICLPPSSRKVGYVFQDYLLFPHMTVLENLLFVNKNKILLEKLIKVFELENILEKYPSQISGGQKQRVAIARALLFNPNVLLLDEPFSALNEGLREKLLYFLYKILKKYNIPTIFVSHNFDEVYLLCDYIVFLDKGNVILKVEKENLFDNLNIKAAQILNYPFLMKYQNSYYTLQKFILDEKFFEFKNLNANKDEKAVFIQGNLINCYNFSTYKVLVLQIRNTNVQILNFNFEPLNIISLKVKKDLSISKEISIFIPKENLLKLKEN